MVAFGKYVSISASMVWMMSGTSTNPVESAVSRSVVTVTPSTIGNPG